MFKDCDSQHSKMELIALAYHYLKQFSMFCVFLFAVFGIKQEEPSLGINNEHSDDQVSDAESSTRGVAPGTVLEYEEEHDECEGELIVRDDECQSVRRRIQSEGVSESS